MRGIEMTDPFVSAIQDSIMDAYQKSMSKLYFGACEFEFSESGYGAGDALPCGRDAVGSSIEDRSHRCTSHLRKE